MNAKSKFFTIVITLIFGVFAFLLEYSNNTITTKINEVYQIYLDGEKIGTISDKEDLYALINKEQSDIREEYNVDQVYPPKGFSITRYNTYSDELTSVQDIYDTIKESKDFTVKGYVVTITDSEDDSKILFRINVLEKDVFEKAINDVVKAFISEDKYNAYLNNTQEIVDVGEKIENIYFKENISIKETYISTNEKIYTDAQSLTKYLLFGDKEKEKLYTVKDGDTISKIADANELNVSEFLVANTRYKTESDLLAVGDEVVVSLISPMLTLVYDVYKVEDVTESYSVKTKYDYNKDPSYKVVETKGVNGIRRVASRTQIINGDANQGAVIDEANTYIIREKVDEVVVRGKKIYFGEYIDDGTNYAWPTNKPYYISSPYGQRYLFNRTYHEAIDITGTGHGSPIYAIQAGEVYFAGTGGPAGNSAGINIIIKHPNGYYSLYAHLSAAYVSKGQVVGRAQKIGAMGKTGLATGTHLHLGVYVGVPNRSGSYSINPMKLYQ